MPHYHYDILVMLYIAQRRHGSSLMMMVVGWVVRRSGYNGCHMRTCTLKCHSISTLWHVINVLLCSDMGLATLQVLCFRTYGSPMLWVGGGRVDVIAATWSFTLKCHSILLWHSVHPPICSKTWVESGIGGAIAVPEGSKGVREHFLLKLVQICYLNLLPSSSLPPKIIIIKRF